MYWLFKNTAFNLTGNANEKFLLEQSQRFKGGPGDQIVTFDFSYNRHFFSHLYNIVEVDQKFLQNSETGGGTFQIIITMQLEKNFEQEKEIEDYIYSFPRIVYYDKFLYRHFNRSYYRLSPEEFRAIVYDEIFMARSILGVSLNALHVEHRKAFSLLLIEKYPDVLQNRFDHREVLDLFNEYFHYAVITPAKQLADAFDNIKSFTENEDLQSLAFSNDNTVKNQDENIAIQVSLISETLDQLTDISLNNEQNYQDYKFERLFWRSPLPIDIN
jgi:hypothetical protein